MSTTLAWGAPCRIFFLSQRPDYCKVSVCAPINRVALHYPNTLDPGDFDTLVFLSAAKRQEERLNLFAVAG